MDFYAPTHSLATLCLVAAICFLLGRWSKSDGPRNQKPIGEVRTAAPQGKRRRSAPPEPEPKREWSLSPEAEKEIEQLLREGKLIAAIKIIRQELGIGLMDAKDMIDHLRRKL